MSMKTTMEINIRKMAEEEVKKAAKKLLTEEYQRGYQDGYNQAKRETPIIINNPAPQIIPQPYYPNGWPTITWEVSPVLCTESTKTISSTTTATTIPKVTSDSYTFAPYVHTDPAVSSIQSTTSTSTGTTGNYTIKAYNTNGPTITVNKVDPEATKTGLNQLLTDGYDLIQDLINKVKEQGEIK